MISTGGEGKVSARKRLRGKIGNPSTAPEIKSCNMTLANPAPISYFNSFSPLGVYAPGGGLGCVWNPYQLHWPAVGAENYQRIGKKIRVRYLRFKGFVASSPFLIQQVRYRFVLYRVKHRANYNMAWQAGLYRHFVNPDNAQDVGSLQDAVAHDYYLSYFDPEKMKEQDCKRRVLFKGLLKPSEDVPNYVIPAQNTPYFKISTELGTDIDGMSWGETPNETVGLISRRAQYNINCENDTRFVGVFQKHVSDRPLITPVNAKAFFPIDFVVNMNDNINCEEYDYVFVVESDLGVGQLPTGAYDVNDYNANYFFRIIPHLYYTDD